MDGDNPQEIDITDLDPSELVQDAGFGNDTGFPEADPTEGWGTPVEGDTSLGEGCTKSADITVLDFGGTTRNMPGGDDESDE